MFDSNCFFYLKIIVQFINYFIFNSLLTKINLYKNSKFLSPQNQHTMIFKKKT